MLPKTRLKVGGYPNTDFPVYVSYDLSWLGGMRKLELWVLRVPQRSRKKRFESKKKTLRVWKSSFFLQYISIQNNFLFVRSIRGQLFRGFHVSKERKKYVFVLIWHEKNQVSKQHFLGENDANQKSGSCSLLGESESGHTFDVNHCKYKFYTYNSKFRLILV
jgi:hypothetical protein